VRAALATLCAKLAELGDWSTAPIAAAIKATLVQHGLKMPQLAVPVRLLVCGRAQTPSVDAVLALFDKKSVEERLQSDIV
jgi:glutamyl-tRNA synthetase